MSGKNKPGKAKIQMSKPDLPPFLQRMKEQIVASEDADRREQSERKRKQREACGSRLGDGDEGPTIVKLNDDDLTEEEYKRMKLELETQYKLAEDASQAKSSSSKAVDLNIDDLISVGQKSRVAGGGINRSSGEDESKSHETKGRREGERPPPPPPSKSKSAPKKLSYESSSSSNSDDDDEDDE